MPNGNRNEVRNNAQGEADTQVHKVSRRVMPLVTELCFRQADGRRRDGDKPYRDQRQRQDEEGCSSVILTRQGRH